MSVIPPLHRRADYISHIEKLENLQKISRQSYVDRSRLSVLHDLAKNILVKKVPGDFVECGVFKGGSAAMIGSILKNAGSQKNLWLFDSFEGFPEPEATDITWYNRKAKKGELRAGSQDVQRYLFNEIGLIRNRVHLVKGWFDSTLFSARTRIQNVSLLHIDCDLYNSVKNALESFYELVSPGGVIVIDDYNYFRGCKTAVDEYISQLSTRPNLIKSDRFGVFFYKDK